jgi:ribosomal protein S18 acetylase RimI-like enzyme
VTIRTWLGEEARSLADVVCGLYEVVFRESPFNGGEREFANQRAYYLGLTSRPGFRLTTARAGDGDYVGFGYGHLLPAGTSWWDGLDEPLPAEMTRETGQRTFAVIDYGVVPAWQGKGIGRAIHDELLGGSGAERATLTVRPTATATLAIYRHWGWRRVAHLTVDPPVPSPEFDMLLLEAVPVRR